MMPCTAHTHRHDEDRHRGKLQGNPSDLWVNSYSERPLGSVKTSIPCN